MTAPDHDSATLQQLKHTLDEIARRQAATEAELARLRASRRRAWRAAIGGMLVLGLGVGLFSARESLAQVACAQTLPAPLKTFCANAPAIAADVNSNFQTNYNWINQKVGTPGSADLTVTGNQTFTGANRQMMSLASSTYGVGVQTDTEYFRSSKYFSFFNGGVHSDIRDNPGAGGTSVLTFGGPGGDFALHSGNLKVENGGGSMTGGLSVGGNLNVGGQLHGATLGRNNCTWRGTGKDYTYDNQWHTMYCNIGEYMAGWQCYATTYLDGSCEAYCCSP